LFQCAHERERRRSREPQLPLLKRPEGRSFFKYKIELHDSELFALAGADLEAEAAKAKATLGPKMADCTNCKSLLASAIRIRGAVMINVFICDRARSILY